MTRLKLIDSMLKPATVFAILMVFQAGGCSTAYVKQSENQSGVSRLSLQDTVFFEVNKELSEYKPNCIKVMPFQDDKNLDPNHSFRKAFHAQLSITGVRLIPLQATSKADRIPECDLQLRGKVLENSKLFLGVYSHYRASAELELFHVGMNKYYWRGQHATVKRSGGIPIDVISILTGATNAVLNMDAAQTGRITFELAERVVKSIPNLSYSDSAQLPQTAHDRSDHGYTDEKSVYQFLTNTSKLEQPAQIAVLEKYLSEVPAADSYAQRLVAERLITLDSNSIPANRLLAFYSASNGSHTQTILHANRLINAGQVGHEMIYLRGTGWAGQGKHDLAIKDFIKAIALGEDTENVYLQLGSSYAAIGRFDLTTVACERVLGKSPSNQHALLLGGVARSAEGDPEGAYAQLRKALVISLAKNDQPTAQRVINTMHTTGSYDMLSEKDRHFVLSKM